MEAAGVGDSVCNGDRVWRRRLIDDPMKYKGECGNRAPVGALLRWIEDVRIECIECASVP